MKLSPFVRIFLWSSVSALGVAALAVLALARGEPVSALWMVVAAVCVFAVAYRFHSAWLMAKVLTLDELRAPPSVVREDGKDFVQTNKWIVFGHHFAAIAGRVRWSARCWRRSSASCRACSGCSSGRRWAAPYTTA